MKLNLEEFTFLSLKNEYVDEILSLQARVFHALPSPELLRKNSAEMFLECTESPNDTLGVFHEDRLCAVGILYVPKDETEDLSHLLLDVAIEKMRSANYKLCMVDVEYRGNGLQIELGKRLEQRAKEKKIDLLCATVSPLNEYSLKNMQSLGYVRNRTLQKYGMTRELFYKFI